MARKKQEEELICCESCGVCSIDDSSVQSRECGCILCEECFPCPDHDGQNFAREGSFEEEEFNDDYLDDEEEEDPTDLDDDDW